MNIHKNARTTPQSRAVLVRRVLREHWPVSAAAIAFGVSARTVYKWLARYRAEGLPGLRDRGSTAHRHPHALAPAWLALIRLLRQAKLVAAEIAARLPLARSTVSAVLHRLGLGRLHYLNPPSQCGAISGVALASSCTWTPRNWAASPSRVIASPAIAATPCVGLAGNTLTLPLTIARATPTSRSCPTEAPYRYRLLVACVARLPSARHPRRARPDRQRWRLLRGLPQGLPLARHQGQTHAPRIDRRPTARPSA